MMNSKEKKQITFKVDKLIAEIKVFRETHAGLGWVEAKLRDFRRDIVDERD